MVQAQSTNFLFVQELNMEKIKMRLKVILFTIAFLSLTITSAAQNNEKEEIQKFMIKTYVEGLHINRDEKVVRVGFHPDFIMQVLHDGKIIKATLDMWLKRLALDGKKNPKRVTHKFNSVDVTGNAAMVKMEIHEDSKHIYTDYFLLYKFGDGWKIVSKTFYSHN